MGTLTTAQLLSLTRAGRDAAPPAGFVPVSSDRLSLPLDVQNVRIDYQAFFNPSTNDLVITGIPRAMERLDLVTQKKIKDTNIFSDSVRITNGPKTGGFAQASDPVTQTETLIEKLINIRTGDYPNATVSFAGEVRSVWLSLRLPMSFAPAVRPSSATPSRSTPGPATGRPTAASTRACSMYARPILPTGTLHGR